MTTTGSAKRLLSCLGTPIVAAFAQRGRVLMASVFLSYDRKDSARAAEIAAALEDSSHSVWWDHQIRGGAQYSKEIEQALDKADAVVVLWSKSSVDSAWVRDEAAEGRDRGKLVPVSLDSARPPIGFRQFQTIDLASDRRSKSKQGLRQLLSTIGSITAAPDAPAAPIVEERSRSGARKRAIAAGMAATLAVAAITFLALRQFTPAAGDDLSAAVVPLDQSPQSNALSTDLMAKLGRFSPSSGAPLRLISPGQQSRAAFVFQVGGSSSGGQSSANLLLLDGRSSAILWSGQFERPAGSIGDLHQEMGYTASQVLGCASDAYRSKELVSKPDLLKSYLDGCATSAGDEPANGDELIKRFRRIVDEVPGFAGGWAQLLMAESFPFPDAAARRRVAADILQARKLDPHLPESYFAEALLVAPLDYGSQIAVIERGIAENPGSALLLSTRSNLLYSVGRTNEAMADGKRAVDLDPTSPSIRSDYIYTLANGGRTQAALDELSAAERFWPGSSDIALDRYIVNSRYGDPKVAAAYVQSSAYDRDPQHALIYLQARMNPTPANVDRAIRDARESYAADPQGGPALMQALGMFGRQAELVDLVMSMPVKAGVAFREILFRPTTRILWLDPRSLAFAKRVGLLQYWQSSGHWPDFCSQPNFPYDCKKEAAKLTA